MELDPVLNLLVYKIAAENPYLEYDDFIRELIRGVGREKLLGKFFGAKTVYDLTPYFDLCYGVYQSEVLKFRSHDSKRTVPELVALRYFNHRYIKALLGGKVVVINKVETKNLVYYDKKTFFDIHSNIYSLRKKALKVKLGPEVWFNSVPTYSVVFDPSPDYKAKPLEYNLWKGFAYKPVENGKSLSYRTFIHEVICNNDPIASEFLLDLMAKIVQHPERKTKEVAVALRGMQGTGKTFFIDTFGKLFGDAYTLISDTSQLTRNFNSVLYNKILVFGDEAIWGGDKKVSSIIKSMITSPTMLIELKYMEPFSANNYIRLFSATNEDWAAPKEFGDRRWFVTDVSEAHIKDTSYFSAIQKDLDEGGYSDLLHYLLNRDYKERDFQETIPTTQASFDAMLTSLSPEEYFIYELLKFGYDMPPLRFEDASRIEEKTAPTFELLDGFKYAVQVDELYMFYHFKAERNRVRYIKRKEDFGRVIFRVLPSVERRRRTLAGTMSDGTKIQHYYYYFPALDEARMEFSQRVGMKIDWESLA